MPYLRSGRPVITANKALLAERWDVLRDYALAGSLYYEASVMAGTPVIGPMSTVLRASALTRLQAVLNGTCLYILGQMEQGKDYAAGAGRGAGTGLRGGRRPRWTSAASTRRISWRCWHGSVPTAISRTAP